MGAWGFIPSDFNLVRLYELRNRAGSVIGTDEFCCLFIWEILAWSTGLDCLLIGTHLKIFIKGKRYRKEISVTGPGRSTAPTALTNSNSRLFLEDVKKYTGLYFFLRDLSLPATPVNCSLRFRLPFAVYRLVHEVGRWDFRFCRFGQFLVRFFGFHT